MHFYVINLDRRTDRWSRLSREFVDNGVSEFIESPGPQNKHTFTRVSAIDGRTEENILDHASLSARQIIRKPSLRSSHVQVFNKGGLACTLSHIKALQLFLKTTDEYVVILEDDIHIHNRFLKFIEKKETDELANAIEPTIHLYAEVPLRSEGFLFGTAAYGLNRLAAEKIIELALPIEVQYDAYLNLLSFDGFLQLVEVNVPPAARAKVVTIQSYADTDIQLMSANWKCLLDNNSLQIAYVLLHILVVILVLFYMGYLLPSLALNPYYWIYQQLCVNFSL